MYINEKNIGYKLLSILIVAFSLLVLIIPSLVTISIKHSIIIEKTILIMEASILFGIVFFINSIVRLFILLISIIFLSVVVNISYTYWLQSDYFPENLLDEVKYSKPTKPRWYK